MLDGLTNRINELKQEIVESHNKLLKYKPIYDWSLRIGVLMIVVLLLTSSFLPCFRDVEEEIDFEKYSQNLFVGNECYMDVVSAIYIGSVDTSFTNQMHTLYTTGYFYVLDDQGKEGIVSVEGEEEVLKFAERLKKNTGSIRCYGKIAEAPESIGFSIESSIESGLEVAMEESNTMEALLSMYNIMECKLDMPITKTVRAPGVGLIFLVLAGVCIVTRIVIRNFMVSESNKVKTKTGLLSLLQQKMEESQHGNVSNEEMS